MTEQEWPDFFKHPGQNSKEHEEKEEAYDAADSDFLISRFVSIPQVFHQVQLFNQLFQRGYHVQQSINYRHNVDE